MKFALMLCTLALSTLFASLDAAPGAGRTQRIKLRGAGQVAGDPTQPGGAPFTAAGNGSHLGTWTNAGFLSIDPVTLVATGFVTFTSSRGDDLRASFQGLFDPATGTADATFAWLGGTGKFFTARGGSADFRVRQSPDGSFTFSADGTIEFVPVP